MKWSYNLSILHELLTGGLDICLIMGAAGILAAVLIHLKVKRCRIIPSCAAALIWIFCEIVISGKTYALQLLLLVVGSFAFCYAAAWLVMDIIYYLKDKKRQTGK